MKDSLKDIVIGIDLGNTNVKCVIIDISGKIRGLYKMPSNLVSISQAGPYIDSGKISNAVAKLCRKVSQMVSGYTIKGMAIATMGCAGVFLDEGDNQLVLPKIKPPQGCIPRLENYTNTCGYARDYDSAGIQLAHMMNYERSSNIKTFLSILDYVNFYLTGIKKRERTTASSMPFMDKINNTDWLDFLDAYRIDRSVLPPICQSGEFIGGLTAAAAKACGLPEGTPVYAGGHDYLCGAFAVGCIGEGDIINVLGTFEMMATFFSKPQKDFYDSDICSFMDFHVYPGRFTITAEHDCISYIKKHFANSNEMTLEERFIQLDQNPKSQPELAEAITLLNKQTAKTLSYLERVGNRNFSAIKVIGGGANSRFWLQDKADTLNIPVIPLKIPEATAVGAALLAGYGCGLYSSYKEASQVYKNVRNYPLT